MLSPRWRKILRDLGGNRTRTLLVVLSIAVGVFAVGVITQTFGVVSQEMNRVYLASNPASATFYLSPYDPETLLPVVRKMPGVGTAEGRAVAAMQIHIQGDEWKGFQLSALPDFNHVEIDKVLPQGYYGGAPALGAERGVWPPPDRELILERSSFLVPGLVPPGLKLGNTVEVRMPDERIYTLKVAGLAKQPSAIPATFQSQAYGFITPDTYEWLTGSRRMNQLSIVVSEDALSLEHVKSVAEQVRTKLEGGGYTVYAVQVAQPGKHWAQDIFTGLSLLLNALGFLSLFLSAFLVINTVSALLAQQTRQIGVMKALGARAGQIVTMYLVTVLVYGLLALAVAVPLSAYVSARTSEYLAGFVNTDFPAFSFSPSVLITQALIALVLPLVAGFFPVLSGTRITVREAISDYGIGSGMQKVGWLDRLLDRTRLVSRPLMLSLRNTFRRKSRLALTMLTLILGGTIFMAVFSVRAAMLLTLDEALEYWKFDVLVPFNRPYRTDMVNQAVNRVPGVVLSEVWGLESVRRTRPDDSESEPLTLFAPPPDTKMLKPTITEGRWLVPEDENAIVVSTDVLRAEKDLKLGDDFVVKIQGVKTHWTIVGVVRVIGKFGGGVGNVYTNYPYYARMSGQVGRAASVQVTTDKHDAAYQAQIQKDLEQSFKEVGIRTASGITSGMIRQQNELFFNIIISLLLVMAVLMALVGGLGLMGTMTLNVMERTREIGVMRAIGASNGAIRQIVLVEGLLIGALSWAVSAVVAAPLGQVLSDAVGSAIFGMPLHYIFSTEGMIYWLVVVLVLSTVASLLPARRASRLTVRQVLAYE